jgi:hypothetical protein
LVVEFSEWKDVVAVQQIKNYGGPGKRPPFCGGGGKLYGVERQIRLLEPEKPSDRQYAGHK